MPQPSDAVLTAATERGLSPTCLPHARNAKLKVANLLGNGRRPVRLPRRCDDYKCRQQAATIG
jgi:hypothetical protein